MSSKTLFNLIFLHGYDSGYAVVVPLLKDRLGDISNLVTIEPLHLAV